MAIFSSEREVQTKRPPLCVLTVCDGGDLACGVVAEEVGATVGFDAGGAEVAEVAEVVAGDFAPNVSGGTYQFSHL